MQQHAVPQDSLPDLTFMERAIVVRAIAVMRENDPDTARTDAQITDGHITFSNAMREAFAAGAGSSVSRNFGAMQITYDVRDGRMTRITIARLAVAAPYPAHVFESVARLPGVRFTDSGDGTYVFDVECARTDAHALTSIAAALQSDTMEFISDADARALGILPPLVD